MWWQPILLKEATSLSSSFNSKSQKWLSVFFVSSRSYLHLYNIDIS